MQEESLKEGEFLLDFIDTAAAVICALTGIIDLIRSIVRDKQEERNHPRQG